MDSRSSHLRGMFLDDSFSMEQNAGVVARTSAAQQQDAENKTSKGKSQGKKDCFDLDEKVKKGKSKSKKEAFDLDEKVSSKRRVKEKIDLDDQIATESAKEKSSRGSKKNKDKSKAVKKQPPCLESGLCGSPQENAVVDLDSQYQGAGSSGNEPKRGASNESTLLDPVFVSIGKGHKLSKVKRTSNTKNMVEKQVNLDDILDTVDEEASAALSSVQETQDSLPNGLTTGTTGGYLDSAATRFGSQEQPNQTHINLDHIDLDQCEEADTKVSNPPNKSASPQANRVRLDGFKDTPSKEPTKLSRDAEQSSLQQHAMHPKSLHDIPLGHPEAPLHPVKVNKALGAPGKSQRGISPRPLLPIAATIACCLFGALALLILGFNFLFSAEEELHLCGVCPAGMERTVSSFVFESNSTVEMMLGLSCDDLELMAKGGVFSEKECKVVNLQAKDSCGCREQTESPTVSPAPTTDPTKAPTGQPTFIPTGTPTTLAPSTAAPTSRTAAPMLYTPAPLPPTPPFAALSQNRDYDRFNYKDTEAYSTYNDFGPKDWGKIRCKDQESCLGWPDTWEYANGWAVDQNHCRWCPAEGGNQCGRHHQSPIDLRRSFSIPGTPGANECLDVHLMKFHDSTCTVQKLREKRAFAVDRHALRIHQPVKWVPARNRYYLDCRNDDVGGMRFGRIDFSFGFSNWWYLSHTDFHMPSEHTQDGKRYDAELQMYHFYSVDAEVAGVNNEMGTVAVFLQAYDDAADYALLNEIICGWREEEERVRRECGLPSVTEKYPGCPDYSRPGGRRAEATDLPKKSFSVNDILLQNHISAFTNSSFEPLEIALDRDEDGEEMHHGPASTYEATSTPSSKLKKGKDQRSLFLDESTVWNNYFPLVDVGTEYYYRYSGTQTVPPCYGQFYPGEENRRQTNHWRVMKDPIRVSHRQINEMHRLTRERIAPRDDPVASCRRDTAAKVDRHTGRVNTARPLQKHHEAHFSVFCECEDWRSASEQDKAWCGKDKQERFYDQPYNFETKGF